MSGKEKAEPVICQPVAVGASNDLFIKRLKELWCPRKLYAVEARFNKKSKLNRKYLIYSKKTSVLKNSL